MNDTYILNDKGEPVPCQDLTEWAKWIGSTKGFAKRFVKDETIDGIRVSTIFLGMDHRFAEGDPILWETMLFAEADGHYLHQYQDRCGGTREQAEAMHEKAKQKILDYMKEEVK